MNINNYLNAGYPGLYVITAEPLRAVASIQTGKWQTYCWNCQQGILGRESGKIVEDANDPLAAVRWLKNLSDSVLIVQNFHHFVGSIEIIQEIQNSIPILKASGCCLVMVGPSITLPPDTPSQV